MNNRYLLVNSSCCDSFLYKAVCQFGWVLVDESLLTIAFFRDPSNHHVDG